MKQSKFGIFFACFAIVFIELGAQLARKQERAFKTYHQFGTSQRRYADFVLIFE